MNIEGGVKVKRRVEYRVLDYTSDFHLAILGLEYTTVSDLDPSGRKFVGRRKRSNYYARCKIKCRTINSISFTPSTHHIAHHLV